MNEPQVVTDMPVSIVVPETMPGAAGDKEPGRRPGGSRSATLSAGDRVG